MRCIQICSYVVLKCVPRIATTAWPLHPTHDLHLLYRDTGEYPPLDFRDSDLGNRGPIGRGLGAGPDSRDVSGSVPTNPCSSSPVPFSFRDCGCASPSVSSSTDPYREGATDKRLLRVGELGGLKASTTSYSSSRGTSSRRGLVYIRRIQKAPTTRPMSKPSTTNTNNTITAADTFFPVLWDGKTTDAVGSVPENVFEDVGVDDCSWARFWGCESVGLADALGAGDDDE